MAGSATEPPARQGLCPDGWHLPSDAEWYALENSLWDGVTGACSASRTSWDCSPAGDKMKSAGLCQGRTPCGTSGFNGLLAGYRLTNGSFFNRTSNGLFWSSTQSSSTSAWDRLLDVSIATVFRGNFIKAFGFSMRCIRN
ncbi:MAG: FISUMP domain-containing protein, partial [Candidatus Staskawiczbacteria bacterium]|nr:FISUMP domain-containing protein [Candidatus Staskawiczbacteria bacterium]